MTRTDHRRRPTRRAGAATLGLALSLIAVAAAPAMARHQEPAQHAGSPGGGVTAVSPVTRLATFDDAAQQSPEGITVAQDGHLYVSFKPLQQVVRVAPDGTATPIATLPGRASGYGGLVGLAAHPDGGILGALANTDPAVNGVWLIHLDGSAQRLAAMPTSVFPNDLVVTPDGQAVLVTDSTGGTVQRVDLEDGAVSEWIGDDLLAPPADAAVPIGANGITFRSDREVVVANFAANTLVSIPVRRDGSAGAASVTARLPGPDGVRADGGALYVAQPLQELVVRVGRDGQRTILADALDGLDGPVSLFIDDDGARGEEQLLITESSLLPTTTRPGVTAIDPDPDLGRRW